MSSAMATLLVALLVQTPPSLTVIPEVDLARLEPAVAEQLAAVRLRLAALVEKQPPAPAEQIAEAYEDLGRAYAAYELDDAAAVCLTRALELDSDNFRWHHLLGFVEARRGEFDNAELHFFEALQRQPGYVPAIVRLADIWLDRGEAERALPHLTRAVGLRPEEASILDRLGEVALSLGDYESALTWFKGALAMRPEANRLHYSVAIAYRGLGRMEEAREHLALRGEVGVRPTDPVIDDLTELLGGTAAFLLRGRMAYRAGRYDEAAEAFGRAATASPDYVAAHVNHGAALAEAGRKEEATQALARALELAPGNVPARYNLARVLRDIGDLEAALEHFGTAERFAPDDADIAVERGRTLLSVGRITDAIAAYETALVTDAGAAAAAVEAAEFLMSSGEVGAAVTLLESLIALRPEESTLGLALVRLLAGGPDLSVRDGARAVELGRRLVAEGGTIADAEALAMALAEVGDCAAAADLQTRLIGGLEAAGAAPGSARLQRLAAYSEGPPCRPPASTNSERAPR